MPVYKMYPNNVNLKYQIIILFLYYNYLSHPLFVKFLSPFDAEARHVCTLLAKLTPKLQFFYLPTTDFPPRISIQLGESIVTNILPR